MILIYLYYIVLEYIFVLTISFIFHKLITWLNISNKFLYRFCLIVSGFLWSIAVHFLNPWFTREVSNDPPFLYGVYGFLLLVILIVYALRRNNPLKSGYFKILIILFVFRTFVPKAGGLVLIVLMLFGHNVGYNGLRIWEFLLSGKWI